MLPASPCLHSGRRFTWQYAGRSYELKWGFDSESDSRGFVRLLKTLPCRINTHTHIYYAVNDPYLGAICSLADHLQELHGGPLGGDLANFLLAFVQAIPYVPDPPVSVGDIPAFCTECLTGAGGDCEDTSILLAALLVRFGFEIAFLYFPHHTAIGVAGSFEGESIREGGRQYYYAETAVDGGYTRIGECFPDHPATVQPVSLRGLGTPSPVRILAVDLDGDRGELRVALTSALREGEQLRLAAYARETPDPADATAVTVLVGAADLRPPASRGNIVVSRVGLDLRRLAPDDIQLDVVAWSDGAVVGRWPGAVLLIGEPRRRR
jgi:hypothetical protein